MHQQTPAITPAAEGKALFCCCNNAASLAGVFVDG